MSTITTAPLFRREPAVSRTGTGTVQRVLLACGILSSLVYVAANVFAGLAWQGYSFAAQTISELSAIGAPSRSVWIPFGFAYDALLIAFGAGVWRCAAGRRRLRAVAGMLFAIPVIGLFWPPMHLRGSVMTLTDTLHVVWAGITSVLILFAIAFGAATSLGRRFRIYSIATIAGMLVLGGLSFLEAPRLAANLPTPWLGIIERLNLAAYLAWVVVLAIVLLRGNRKEGASQPDRA